jgi:hypothetical protein
MDMENQPVATRLKSRRNRGTRQHSRTTQETSATDKWPTKKRQEKKGLPDDEGSDSVKMDVSKENNKNFRSDSERFRKFDYYY